MTQRKQPLTDIHTARAEAAMPMAQVHHGTERWHDVEEGQATSTHDAIQSPRSEAQSLPSYAQPPQSEAENLPVPTSPPTELGPRPAIADKMGAAVRATSTGIRLVAGATQKGSGYATAGSHIILDAGIQAGIAAGPLLTAAGALGPPLASGLGQGLVTVVGGAGAVVGAAGPPLLSGSAALASNVGHGLVAVAKAGAHVTNEHLRPALGALTQGALHRGIPVLRGLADGSYYAGSAVFSQLYDIIHDMPEIPSLDVYRGPGSLDIYHPGLQLQTSDSTVEIWSSPVHNALTYGALRTKKRSDSPTARPPRYVPTTANAAAAAAAESKEGVQVDGTNNHVISHDTVAEWEKLGRGTIINQLMIRSGFHTAVNSDLHGSKRSTAAIIKRLSRHDMIQLLLKLDHKK